jgi:hypothetical protein
MSETPTFPYETRLNILYQPLEIVEEKALADACAYRWYNQTLCQVNSSVHARAPSFPKVLSTAPAPPNEPSCSWSKTPASFPPAIEGCGRVGHASALPKRQFGLTLA